MGIVICSLKLAVAMIDIQVTCGLPSGFKTTVEGTTLPFVCGQVSGDCARQGS